VSERQERRLRGALCLGGTIATLAGLHTMLAGGKSFPPWRHAGPMVESELRFYSAFYVAYGLHSLRASARAKLDPTTLNATAAALFLAGAGRAGAWVAVGKPHPLQRALLAIELAAPALVLLERARRQPGSSAP
jgi:Domain of unknown function (DUF4345)